MLSSNDLIAQIREAFKDAVFPAHLGLHAALAMDRWVKDAETLKKITTEKDYWGDWWDVPYEHLEKSSSLAFCYLDSIGVYFYFPAFMLKAIQEKTPKSLIPIITIMDPPNPFKHGKESYLYFCEQFNLFDDKKKKLCRDFLCFMKAIHAGQTGLIKGIDEILQSSFWESNHDHNG